MMTGLEMMFAIVIAAIAGSLLLDILHFVFHTLPNILRQTKPVNPDYATMAMVLDDMQFLGLTKLKPVKTKRARSKPQAEDQN